MGFVEQIGKAFDRRLLMYLEFRHQQHLRKGLPQICMSSFDPVLRIFDILKMTIRGLSNVKVTNKGLKK